jgi:hypothetical protein
MKRWWALFFVIALSSCVTGGSREYRPINENEKAAFDKANRHVFPDDVRESIEKYREVTLAWTGIIEETDLIENEGYLEYIILCRHYYYDWIESFGPGTAAVWLSTKGEGEFALYLRIDRSVSHEDYLKMLAKNKEDGAKAKGNMLIAYGRPSKIENEVIYLDPWYFQRQIEKMWFTQTPEVYVENERDKQHGR